MKRLLFTYSIPQLFAIVVFFMFGASVKAQNIVPNPSLENYTTCPTSVAQIDNLIGWAKIPNHTGSSDMINACNGGIVNCPNNAFGNQNAHSGVGYFGFASYYQSTPGFREYTYCTFLSPMVAGTTYDISFWVSLSDNSQYGSDDALQIYFSNTVVNGTGGNWNPITTITPQIINTTMITDKINWIQVSYQYTAVGGELYMTLGNFDTDVNTNTVPAGAGTYSTVYYYVDDFIVEPVVNPCDPSWTTTTACSADPAINLDALITGDTGGTWSGTGVTGNTFNPSSGTQTITYTAPGGCTLDQVITVTPSATATWTIPTNLCDSDAAFDLTPFITGTTGGTWSGTGVTGSMFDPSVGTQNITYTVGTVPCDDAVTQTITVGMQASAAWTPPAGLCTSAPSIDLNTTITGTAGGTWSGTGVTGSMFDPSVGTQTITYTVGTAPCDDVSSQSITVSPTASATWTAPTGLCAGDAPIDLSTYITGNPGGTFTGTGITGTMFDPSVGTQTINYSVGVAPCDATENQTITVSPLANPSWTVPTPVCENDADINLTTLITGDAGGIWSGTGITGSMFDPSVGTQTLTYTVGTGGCQDNSAQSLAVTPNGDATWTIPTNICIGDAPFDLNTFITGTTGGTWSGTGITGSMFDPSVGTQSITYSVGTAPCDDVLTQNITVATALNAGWTVPTNICETDAPINLDAQITGDTGGTWSGTGVSGNTFDPSAGTQTVTYTVGTGGCQATSAQSVTVDTSPNPSWTSTTLCTSSAPINLTGQVTGTAGGSWSGTGMSGSVFDPFFGTQNITYTVTNGACTASLNQAVTVVDPQVSVTGTGISCFGLTDGSAIANVTGGSGNYTYLWNPSGQNGQTASNISAGTYQVTVTDVDGGCTVVGSVTIIEPAEIVMTMVGTNGCAPSLGAASVTATGGVGGFTYEWTPSGQTTALALQLDSAMHVVTVTDANGCTNTDSVLVQILPPPNILTIDDTTIIYPNCIQLPVTGGVTYEWIPDSDMDDNTSSAPTVCPMFATQYCVTGTDASGCVNSDCVMINVDIICGEVFVPSAFSPNADGENDLLCVYSDCMESMTFTIYNRWGEKIYETNSMNICWDGTWKGKQLNSAVFVYILDGYLINGQLIEQKGNISLIR